MTDPDIQETMIENVDMSTRAWFVTMCGFGFEKIIVEIAKRNGIKHDRLNIKPKFKGVCDGRSLRPTAGFMLGHSPDRLIKIPIR
ncbi:MAG: hypothetical protein MPI93_02175 [Nitrosopumilus sp.]|nr:hypothetical protein [Nitrosopumilus sp.]